MKEDVDGRDKPGHDGKEVFYRISKVASLL